METGIYLIRNKINQRVYVGSAAVSFRKRFGEHLKALKGNIHRNRHLQSAWNKYGEDAFEFLSIDERQPQFCEKLEQWYINQFPDAYNICRTVGSGSHLGVRRNKETCQKISRALRGRTHNRISASSISVRVIDDNSKTQLEFPSIGKAAQALHIKSQTLVQIIRGDYNSLQHRHLSFFIKNGDTYTPSVYNAAKQSAWHHSRCREVVATNTITNETLSFPCVKDLASNFGLNVGSLRNFLQGVPAYRNYLSLSNWNISYAITVRP